MGRIRKHAPEPQRVSNLNLGELCSKLTPAELWGIGIALGGSYAAVAAVAFRLGQFFAR
jgi:hypothetical protein